MVPPRIWRFTSRALQSRGRGLGNSPGWSAVRGERRVAMDTVRPRPKPVRKGISRLGRRIDPVGHAVPLSRLGRHLHAHLDALFDVPYLAASRIADGAVDV